MGRTKEKTKQRGYAIKTDGICCPDCGCYDLRGDEADKSRVCNGCGKRVRMQVIVPWKCVNEKCDGKDDDLKVGKTIATVPVKRYLVCRKCGETQVRYGGKR